jgi:hypothetical protein
MQTEVRATFDEETGEELVDRLMLESIPITV